MNVVFLSPHYPPSWWRFCAALREMGATVLGIADAPWESLRPELRAALAEYYRVGDLHRTDELVRAMGWLTHRHGKIDRVDSLNEHWLEIEAGLRTDFNVPGLKSADMARVKRKEEMKRTFREAGIPVARGRACATAEEVRAFAREVGTPLVAKPDVGVGASRTWKIEDEAGLERFVAELPPVPYLLEEFVRGTIVTYDGLADREGNVVFDSTMTYSQGVMEAVNDDSELWYVIPREIPADLRAIGRRTVAAFGVRERPFHFEYFRTPDGRLVALEVNVRPPGGLTVDMFNYANDFDFAREWARVVVHGRFEARIDRPWACAYVGRKDRLRHHLSHEEVRARFAPLLVHEERIGDVFAPAIGNQGYVLRARDVETLARAAREIQEPEGR